jgi:hypothetical protein
MMKVLCGRGNVKPVTENDDEFGGKPIGTIELLPRWRDNQTIAAHKNSSVFSKIIVFATHFSWILEKTGM